jgi:sugar lactone lactonase YvrE
MSEAELVREVEGQGTECPVWDDRSRRIFFADHRGGRIYALGVDGGDYHSWDIPGGLGSFGLCESGNLVVALPRGLAILDLSTGDLYRFGDSLPERAGNSLNDGKVGPDLRYWVGSLDGARASHPEQAHSGNLYRYDPDGHIDLMATGYAASNGLAWTADGRTMFHSDSFVGTIDRWDFDPETGSISAKARLRDLTSLDGKPDGAACDLNGNYWSAAVSAGCVNVFTREGALVDKIDLPTPAPSMVCFAEGYVYVTALLRDADSMVRSAVDVSNYPYNTAGLFRFSVEVQGVEVPRFPGH